MLRSLRRFTCVSALSILLMLAVTTTGILPAYSAADYSTGSITPVVVADATVTPDPVSPIDVLTIGIDLENRGGRQDGLVVATQVRSADGQTVLEARQGGIGIDPARTQSVYWVWRVPQRVADGHYTVEVEVLGPDGQTLLDREENAASFQVVRK